MICIAVGADVEKTGIAPDARRRRVPFRHSHASFHPFLAIALSLSREPYVGTVQMPRDNGSRCEHLEFVNETAALRPKGYGMCASIQKMQRPPEPEPLQKPESLDGSAERLKSIGQGFKPR